MVHLFAIRSGEHSDGVAAEVLVESARGTPTSQHGLLIHGHRVVFVVEVGVKLACVSLRGVEVVAVVAVVCKKAALTMFAGSPFAFERN